MGLLDRLRGESPGAAVARALEGTSFAPPRQELETRISRPVISSSVSPTVAGGLAVAGDLRRASEEGYSGSSLAFRCVQTIATNAASLDLVVERQGPEGLEPVEQHPVSVLFNRNPNPAMSARVFKETLWAQLELLGESFVYLDRGPEGTGPIAELWPVYDPVEVVVNGSALDGGDSRDLLAGFRVKTQAGRKVALLPGEVLWLRYPHPRYAWASMSPFRAAQFALDLDGWAKAWQLGELRNGARPEGVVYLGDVEEETHNRIVTEFRSRHEGPRNANRHLFVSGPEAARYTRVGLTPQEASYKDTRDSNAEEVFLAFGVPRDYLLGGTTYENRTAARRTLWTDTLLPKLEVVAGEIDRQLLPDLGETCRFDTSNVDALAENEESISGRVREQMYADVLLVDEARERLNLPPLEGGLGQHTLTAYRQIVEARGNAEEAELVAEVTPPAARSREELPALEQAYRDSLPARAALPASRAKQRKPRPLPLAEVEREYDRLEAIGRKAVKRLAEKQERVVLGNLERSAKGKALHRVIAGWDAASPEERSEQGADAVRAQVRDFFDPEFWQEFTREALGDTLVAGAYDSGGARTAASLGISFDLIAPGVEAAMRDRADALASQVTETTRLALEEAVLDPGVQAGESVPDLAARLRGVFDQLSSSRAETIARTETVGGFNAASRTAAVASGVVVAREWLAASDARVRETHAALDGYQTSGLDDPYPNGCRHPGDPAGPAAETINCRCVETYVVEED